LFCIKKQKNKYENSIEVYNELEDIFSVSDVLLDQQYAINSCAVLKKKGNVER